MARHGMWLSQRYLLMSSSHTLQDTYIIKYFTVYFNKINKFIQRKDYFQWVNNNGKDTGNACIKTKIGQTNIQRIAGLLIAKSLNCQTSTQSICQAHSTSTQTFLYGFITQSKIFCKKGKKKILGKLSCYWVFFRGFLNNHTNAYIIFVLNISKQSF